MIYKFYDTNAVLIQPKEQEVKIVISSITAEKLKPIMCIPKDWDIVEFNSDMLRPIFKVGFTNNNEGLKNLACAFNYDCTTHPDETIFVTTDIELADIANCFFGEDSIETLRVD